MANTELTQSEADALIAMEKHRADDDWHSLPKLGGSLSVALQSADHREQFILDISQGRIDLLKVKMQNRARQVVVLMRLDLAGPPHRNPNGDEVGTPHLHVYRLGYADKWAIPIPLDIFTDTSDCWQTLLAFMRYCNITQPPKIQRGLFI